MSGTSNFFGPSYFEAALDDILIIFCNNDITNNNWINISMTSQGFFSQDRCGFGYLWIFFSEFIGKQEKAILKELKNF